MFAESNLWKAEGYARISGLHPVLHTPRERLKEYAHYVFSRSETVVLPSVSLSVPACPVAPQVDVSAAAEGPIGQGASIASQASRTAFSRRRIFGLLAASAMLVRPEKQTGSTRSPSWSGMVGRLPLAGRRRAEWIAERGAGTAGGGKRQEGWRGWRLGTCLAPRPIRAYPASQYGGLLADWQQALVVDKHVPVVA